MEGMELMPPPPPPPAAAAPTGEGDKTSPAARLVLYGDGAGCGLLAAAAAAATAAAALLPPPPFLLKVLLLLVLGDPAEGEDSAVARPEFRIGWGAWGWW